MEQFVFNEVELDNSVIENLRKYNDEFIKLDSPCFVNINVMHILFHCRDLLAWFKQNNCIPSSCIVIKNDGNGHGNIHSDVNPGFLSNIALNIGIHPGENSYTEIYKVVSGNPVTVTIPSSKNKFQNYNDCMVEKIASYDLKKPVVLNTQCLHKIFNFGNKIRTTYSFRFKTDPIELMVKKIGPEGPIYIADPLP